MRIRKRKVPLPLSLLSPVPLTDHDLFGRSPVTLVQQATADYLTQDKTKQSQPYDDLINDVGRLINDGSSTSDDHRDDKCYDPLVKEQELGYCLTLGGADVNTVQNNDDFRKKNITVMGAAAANNGLSPLSNDEGKWCNGDKSIPLKKRRGSAEVKRANVDREKHLETKKELNDEQKEQQKETITDNKSNNNNGVSLKKGSKRGNTIMEGSRCSRVNGRGWRCCQPTLVGYSLCEHHLGKGRLRNMQTNAQGRPSLSRKEALGTSSATSSPSLQPSEGENKRKKACTNSSAGKRPNKLGVVKARSLSSLLG